VSGNLVTVGDYLVGDEQPLLFILGPASWNPKTSSCVSPIGWLNLGIVCTADCF
jgi:hypothetical protein